MRSTFSKIATYEAVDNYTIRFVLSKGAGTFLSELGLGVRAAIIAKECVNSDGTIIQPIGTGSFVFESWKQGEEWRARRFDKYWGEIAHIDEVKFIPIVDDTARLIALQTGEVDWTQTIPFDKVHDTQQNPPDGIKVHLVYRSNTLRLNFNATRQPFNDQRVRQAIAYAIDKNEINQGMLFGIGSVHNQPFAADSFLHLDVPDAYIVRNLDKAKALLAEAGYRNGFEVTVIHPSGWLKGFWELIGAQLSPLNIKLNVEMLDGAQWTDRATKLDYDMMIDQQSNIFSWERSLGYFDKNSSSNWLVGGYHKDEISSLLDQGRNETDLTIAKPIYTKILQMLQDDAAAIFIVAIPDVQAWRLWLQGFEPSPMNAYLVWPGGGLNYASLDEKPSNN